MTCSANQIAVHPIHTRSPSCLELAARLASNACQRADHVGIRRHTARCAARFSTGSTGVDRGEAAPRRGGLGFDRVSRVATLIVGPTEVLVWDAQYHAADAERLANRIAATGKRLTAVIISHPDHDHYMGAAKIVERFPGTPVYMTAAGLAEFQQTASRQFQGEKSRQPALIPDSLVTPKVIPSTHFAVDGEAVDVIPDLTGDVMTPTNSFLWIPSTPRGARGRHRLQRRTPVAGRIQRSVENRVARRDQTNRRSASSNRRCRPQERRVSARFARRAGVYGSLFIGL